MDSASVKNLILNWIRLITYEERYYFAKAIDIFIDLPAEHQRSLIEYFARTEEQEQWTHDIDDSTQYISVIRSILFYFSGRTDKDAAEPNKEVFAKKLAEYMKSDEFKGAGKEREAKKFTEELASI